VTEAVSKLTNDPDAVLAFHDFTAEHWIHLRTSEPDRVDVLSGEGPTD
jgi:hypothetical protein